MKINQQIKFDSDLGILTGTIIELYKYPQPDLDGDTYTIVVEVEGSDVNYNLSEEHII